MDMDRRTLLGGVVLTGVAGGLPAPQVSRTAGDETFVLLNNAGTHPLHPASAAAIQEYVGFKSSGVFPPGYSLFSLSDRPRSAFARLINADPSEIALTQSTSMGENLVVNGLGIPGSSGNVVTDALHHEGSLYLYRSIETERLEIRVAKPKGWQIDIADFDRLIDANTKLVAISLVSWINGFQHDLKAVCDLAHSRGALVYVDLIQGAGVVPIDVKAAGVDFACCATYKWLMGDCGVAFLYVRESLLDRVRRSQWGFMQFDNLQYHVFPYDPPGEWTISVRTLRGARGRYEVGTPSFAAIVAAGPAIEHILQTGVSSISARIRPLVDRLQEEMPRLGFAPMTPRESRSAITAFLTPDPAKVRAALKKHRIQARLMGHQLRISPASHNTGSDIDRLLHALAK